MARSLNEVNLIGRVGSDPDVNTTTKGHTVANFSLATNPQWNKDVTEWHRITAWRKLAEIVDQYVTKGALVYVKGRLTYDKYEDQNGSKQVRASVIADKVIFLRLPSSQQVQNEGHKPRPQSSGNQELPF